jgi:hypothetical protein
MAQHGAVHVAHAGTPAVPLLGLARA